MFEPEDNFTESGFDRKARYIGANPQEVERERDMRQAFLKAEIADESFEGLTGEQYFDIPAPTDKAIMSAAGLSVQQWDAIKRKNRALIADYRINEGGSLNFYKRELTNIIVALKDKLLETIVKQDKTIARPHRGGTKGMVRTLEQRERMSEGQKTRYAKARMKGTNNVIRSI